MPDLVFILELITLFFCVLNVALCVALRNWFAVGGWYVGGIGMLKCCLAAMGG